MKANGKSQFLSVTLNFATTAWIVLVVIATLLGDILYTVVDPRIRYS